MKMARKKKLEKLKKQHNNYIKSLGVVLDEFTGEVMTSFDGYDMPDYSCRPSLPTGDNITGSCTKKKYATTVKDTQRKQHIFRSNSKGDTYCNMYING